MTFRQVLAAAAAGAALTAHASNYSDLYYDPQQPGSGVSVVQQLETAFVTIYGFGPDGKPTWFVASDAPVIAYSTPGALPVFSGPLYKAEGSYHGGPYDASKSKMTQVGTLSLEALDRDRLRVHYTADGVSVVREVRRYTFAQEIDLANYVAQASLRQVRAGQPFGTLYLQADLLVHLDPATGIGFLRADDSLGHRCEYRGPYAISGKLARVSGTYTCNGGDQPAGTFELTDLEFTTHGFTGYLRTAVGNGDSQYGRLAGLRW